MLLSLRGGDRVAALVRKIFTKKSKIELLMLLDLTEILHKISNRLF